MTKIEETTVKNAKKRAYKIVAALATVATLMLSGCAGGAAKKAGENLAELPPLAEIQPVADPSKVEGPVTVKLTNQQFKPATTDPAQKLPVTVTSHTLNAGEKQVTVKSANRVMALSLTGALADYVYGLGLAGKLVGRDVSTGFPGADKIPLVTQGGHSIDAEAVLSHRPDLIITDGTVGPTDVIDQFADAGVTVVYVKKAETYDQHFAQMREVGKIMGANEAADPLEKDLRQRLADKEAEIKRLLPADKSKLPRVAFLYMRGKGIFYMFGKGTGFDAMLKSLGAIDVATEIGWEGHKPMNDEALVKANPDTIIVMTRGLESVGGVDGMMKAHPAVALTDAGKRRHIIDIYDTSLFTGATRLPEVLDGLARAIYAPNSLR
ncbi:MAG: ABC transporter substrate-binding protein [Microbacteriaceae bacterium]|nr:ABC transporter substrate-binding protein [Microbacteriaceae bacterium]